MEEINSPKMETEELLLKLYGRSDPHIHDCIIAVDERGVGVLLHSNPSLHSSEVFDDMFLEYNLTSTKEIPKDPGVYKCEIEVQSFRSNTLDDPEEWDMYVILKNVVKLKLRI